MSRLDISQMVVFSPGETILEIIQERGMNQVELATPTGLSRKTINEIVKGEAAITPGTAIELEHVLGVPASFWNNNERSYRAFVAQQREREF